MKVKESCCYKNIFVNVLIIGIQARKATAIYLI